MGYCASGYGTISLRPDVDKERLNEVLETINEMFMEICEVDKAPDQTDIIVSHSDKFCCDDALEMLEGLNEDTVHGEIEMEGEDDCRWRYRFSEKYHKWVEEAHHDLYEVYREDKNGDSYYEVPAYALVYRTYQSEYTEPRYYEAAKDASDIRKVFVDKARAEGRCRELNEQLALKGEDHDGCYAVEETTLNI